MELAVDVAADGDGGVDGNDIAFFDEQFPGFVAEFAHLRFGDGATGAQLGYGSRCQSVESVGGRVSLRRVNVLVEITHFGR